MWRLIAPASQDDDGAPMKMTTCPECGTEGGERQCTCLQCNTGIAVRHRDATSATSATGAFSIGALRAARPTAWLGAALLMGVIGQLLCSYANHEAQLRLKAEAARAESARARATAGLPTVAPDLPSEPASDLPSVPTLDGGHLVSFEQPSSGWGLTVRASRD